MDWAEKLQIRCIKYRDTNYKKTVREIARSPQRDIGIGFSEKNSPSSEQTESLFLQRFKNKNEKGV